MLKLFRVKNEKQTDKQTNKAEGYQFGEIENFAGFKKHSATDLSGSNYNIP